MAKDKNKYKKLIKKVLSEDAGLKEMGELAKLSFVERRMKAQWEEGKDKQRDDKLEQKIWERIEGGCRTKQESAKRRLYIGRIVAAACIALLAVAGAFWLEEYRAGARTPEFIEVLANENCSVMLPDSSRVWIKDGSSIKYEKLFAQDRKVWLEGEAIFEVRKRAGSPFRVLLDGSFVEVKGTVFRVVNRKEQTQEVDLFSGKVEFNAEAFRKKVIMEPNQYLLFNPGKGSVEVKEMDKVNWQNGKYTFKEIKTETLIRIVSRIYNAQISLADDIGEDEYFNGSIRMEETLDDVLEKICYNLDVDYKKEGNKYILYIK